MPTESASRQGQVIGDNFICATNQETKSPDLNHRTAFSLSRVS